ncbi:MAG: carboxypeptidase-like regulatory domain-containing protein [Cytophagales bacterium]|nr:carboxypeptidase-like regulatory domain-containing protein [Cytophagales bacterium]
MIIRLLYLFLISTSLVIVAKSHDSISGIVQDEKYEPIPGANVMIKDSYDGASSGINGKFSFVSEESGPQIVVVTFVGFKTFSQTLELAGKDISVQVSLKEEINQLDGVVISAGSFTAGDENRRTILKPIDIATTAGATADIAGALNTLTGNTKGRGRVEDCLYAEVMALKREPL